MTGHGTHRGCGGEIREDPSITYEHEGAHYPALICSKCGVEILGDAEINDPFEED